MADAKAARKPSKAARKATPRKPGAGTAAKPVRKPSPSPPPASGPPPASVPPPAWQAAPGWQPVGPPPARQPWPDMAPQARPSMRPEEERQYAMFLHLSALAGIIVGFFFLGPLVMWLIKKDESAFVDRHGRTAVDFHLSVLLYTVAAGLLLLVVAVLTLGIGLLVLLPVFIVAAIAAMVAVIALPIVACLRAQAGQEYTYPLSIRFLSERIAPSPPGPAA